MMFVSILFLLEFLSVFAVMFCIHVSFIFLLCELKGEGSSLSFNRSHTDTGPASIASPIFTVLVPPVVW